MMEGDRHLKVESKSFVFSKVGGNSIRSSKYSVRMVKFIFLSGSSALWVAMDFSKKLSLGNEVLTIHCHVNSRGCFLQLAEVGNERRGFFGYP